MSWLFSQALVGASLVANFLGGEQCAQLNVKPTQHKFWRNDRTMEPLSLSQFGATCAVLTDAHGEELLTSYLEGFRAKTSAQQEKAPELTEHDQDFGAKWQELLVRYDRDSCSWCPRASMCRSRTCPCGYREHIELLPSEPATRRTVCRSQQPETDPTEQR
jgi:hypothetical protein